MLLWVPYLTTAISYVGTIASIESFTAVQPHKCLHSDQRHVAHCPVT